MDYWDLGARCVHWGKKANSVYRDRWAFICSQRWTAVGVARRGRAPAAATPADAKAAAKEAEPVTTKDPQIALDDLELLLEPMTKRRRRPKPRAGIRCCGPRSAKSPWRNWMFAARTAKSRNWRNRRRPRPIWRRPRKRSKPPRPTRTRRRPPSTSRKRRRTSPRRSKPQARRPQRRRRRPRRPPPRWPSKPMRPLRRPPPSIPGPPRRARRSCRRGERQGRPAESGRIRGEEVRGRRRHRQGREGGRGD